MSSKKVNNSKPSATVANPNILPVEMLKLAKYTDVTLICSASKIRAHRIVLAVRSAYFQEYFKRHGKATEIVLDVDFDDLKCIILYMYQGVIVIPSDRKTSFLEIAKEFKVSIDEKKMFAVKTRMENFGGNGKLAYQRFVDGAQLICHYFRRAQNTMNQISNKLMRKSMMTIARVHTTSSMQTSTKPRYYRAQWKSLESLNWWKRRISPRTHVPTINGSRVLCISSRMNSSR